MQTKTLYTAKNQTNKQKNNRRSAFNLKRQHKTNERMH